MGAQPPDFNLFKIALKVADFATVRITQGGDIVEANSRAAPQVPCLVNGEWWKPERRRKVHSPRNGTRKTLYWYSDTRPSELQRFLDAAASCPRYGLHNPLYNVERYRLYADVVKRFGQALANPEILEWFVKLGSIVVDKHPNQIRGEFEVLRMFCENFSGDNVRFLAKNDGSPGNHDGQTPQSYRWPYGAVAQISPFNFPAEIPFMQLLGALFMGNRCTMHVDPNVSIVMWQMILLLEKCGMPLSDMDFVVCRGPVMGELLKRGKDIFHTTQFTGGSEVAELLAHILSGKISIEDAGLGTMIVDANYVSNPELFGWLAWRLDACAFASTGQKCSALSLLFYPEDEWADFAPHFEKQAGRRNFEDRSLGAVFTVSTAAMQAHVDKGVQEFGAEVVFGGSPPDGHPITDRFGVFKPTCLKISLQKLLESKEAREWAMTEIFGPIMIVVTYGPDDKENIAKLINEGERHLTGGILSHDMAFILYFLRLTLWGTSYAGTRARTTGAPQNHWFGPAGDPRAAGIGTIYAILLVWSCHREIVFDFGEPLLNYDAPAPT